MYVDNLQYLKVWISDHLKSICVAEPKSLATIIVTIIEEKKNEADVRETLLNELRGFLKSNTNLFVELLFQTIETRSYMGSAFYGPELPNREINPHASSSFSAENSCKTDEVLKRKNSGDSCGAVMAAEPEISRDKCPSNKISKKTSILLLSNALDKFSKAKKNASQSSKNIDSKPSEKHLSVAVIKKKLESLDKSLKSRESKHISIKAPDFKSSSQFRETSKVESKLNDRRKRFSSTNENEQVPPKYRTRSPIRRDTKETFPETSFRQFNRREPKFRNSRYPPIDSDNEMPKSSRSPFEAKNKSLKHSPFTHRRNRSSDSSDSDNIHSFKRHARMSLSPRRKDFYIEKLEIDKRFLKSNKKSRPVDRFCNSDNEFKTPSTSPETKRPRSSTRSIVKYSDVRKIYHEEGSGNVDTLLRDKRTSKLNRNNTTEEPPKKHFRKCANESVSESEASDKDEFKPVSTKSRAVYGKCGPTSQKEVVLWVGDKQQANENGATFSHDTRDNSSSRRCEKIRCKDFDEKGYCMLGDFCSFDHGTNPVVFDHGPGPLPIVPLPLQDNNSMRMIPPPPPHVLPYNPYSVSREQYDPERPSIAQTMEHPALPPPRLFHTNTLIYPPFSSTPIPRPFPSRGARFCGPQYITPHVNLNNFVPAQTARHYPPSNYHNHRQSVHVNQNLISLTFRETRPAEQRRYRLREPNYYRDTSTVEDNNLNVSVVANENSETVVEQKPDESKWHNVSRALIITNIPSGSDKIGVLNDEFSKFGKVTNIQLRLNGSPEKALLHFNTKEEAGKAYEHFNSSSVFSPFQVSWYTDEDMSNDSRPMTIEIKRNQPINRRQVILNRYPNKNFDKLKTIRQQLPDLREELTKKRNLCKEKMKGFLTACVGNAKTLIEKRSRTTDDSEKEVLRQLLLELAMKVISIQESWDGEKPKEIQDMLNDFTSKIHKEMLDAELDLYSKERKGDDIIDLSKTLNGLKEKFELLSNKHSEPMKANTNLVHKKRFIPHTSAAIIIRKIDRRPKSLLIKHKLEFDDKNKRDELQKFLSHLQGKEDIKAVDNDVLATFKTRALAEAAFEQISKFWMKFCVISWFSEEMSTGIGKSQQEDTDSNNELRHL